MEPAREQHEDIVFHAYTDLSHPAVSTVAGEDSVRSLNMLEDELAAQRAENENLEARNRLLEIEVVDLKNGLEAVEERARSELGMIGEDETFYLIID